MKHVLVAIVGCLLAGFAVAQKPITNEAIWGEHRFRTQTVPGFNFLKDGRHYTRLVNGTIKKYDVTTGEWAGDLFSVSDMEDAWDFGGQIDRFTFSEDEKRILIESETDRIYRRSYRAKYHVADLESGEIYPVFEEGKIMNATLSPDGQKIAYVYFNDLYFMDLNEGITLPITHDGSANEIINGSTDWVYEEEFGFVKAFWWSPDSRRIAFLRFDESEVKEFTMTYYENDDYPRYETFKYPKVGEKNSDVTAFLYEIGTERLQPVDLGDLKEVYIPRVKWSAHPDKVCFYKMNRHQNDLKLILVNAESLEIQTMLHETNPYYIDVTDDLTFLDDGESFIWTSEQNGFNHIYKYGMDGRKTAAITMGSFDVTNFYGVDEKNNKVYYQAAARTPLEREIYEAGLDGTNHRMISQQPGMNSARFSSTFDYFTLTRSTINTPPVYAVLDRQGETIRVLEDNGQIEVMQDEHGVVPISFFDFETEEGVLLNGWMIKPPQFDPGRSYPVFMYQYSGPGSQQVVNGWRGTNYWWFQMLARQGYIIACVDGRGTGARGQEFKKMTYMNLGHYETIDQIEAAKYLGGLPYTDASRIGIFGWSYGGYMSSLCILKGNNVFSSAIAVAPVTNWKWYDTIYTERYMRTEEENPNGYKQNSPVNFADRLRGRYLLVHGATDDNVHFQNSMEMARALISANKQFDQYIYPNRNHGISGDNARLHLYNKMTEFLSESLLLKENDVRP